MASLLETYEQMVKMAQAEEQTEQQVEETAVEGIDNETLEVLNKYAEAADAYLAENYGEGNYNDDHIIKVANEMIEYDVEQFQAMEKVAELHEAGIIMAKAFKEELAKG